MGIPCVVFHPSAPHTHTVVFLHGRGDNAKKFSSWLNYWLDSKNRSLLEIFPSFRWVFPQAEIRDLASFRGSQMTQWFDVWNVKDFSEREELQAVGLKESVDSIRHILHNEVATLGQQWDRIILAGISQGAATSIHTLLNLDVPAPHKLGALLGFSCRMPFSGRTLADTRKILALQNVPDHDALLRNTPVLLEHCVDDPLVLVQNGRALRETLQGFGAQVEWREYPDGGHWFNAPSGVEDMVRFLTHVLDLGVQASQSQAPSDAMDTS